MKVLFLEPFFGGSHKDFALGFKAHSRHDVDLVTMPARFWKWRMRGAAVHFLSAIKDMASYDVVFATDLMDLTDFKGMGRKPVPPVLFYFHENQLAYPLSPGEKRDFHMGFTNIVSAYAADKVLFNSRFHLNTFMDEAGRLLSRLPDYRPSGLIESIREKSAVAYPGCRFDTGKVDMEGKQADPPIILWNHRWEHDKNPDDFFSALDALENEGVSFELAVLGENFNTWPPVFERAREKFKGRIRVFGYAENRRTYLSWLQKSAIIVSCARQENFGISAVEAIRHGCIPLLPDRLSYPELIPLKHHRSVLYRTKKDLVEKLKKWLTDPDGCRRLRRELSIEMEGFAWRIRVKHYDKALKNIEKTS